MTRYSVTILDGADNEVRRKESEDYGEMLTLFTAIVCNKKLDGQPGQVVFMVGTKRCLARQPFTVAAGAGHWRDMLDRLATPPKRLGRPPATVDGSTRVVVFLPNTVVKRLRSRGEGNLSVGLREFLARHGMV